MVIRNDSIGNKHPINIDDDLDIDEECCEAPDVFVTIDGKIVCRHCGICFGTQMVGHERRAYTAEEVRSRRRTEPVWRCFGPRTVISAVKTDLKGRQIPASKQALFARLSKIQGSLISSIERNYWEAKPKLQAIANKLGIPDFIVETAWKIYSEVAKQKLTMGRSIQAFAAASLYAAIRIHNFPRLMEEMTDPSLNSLRAVHRSLGLIIRSVLPKLGYKYRPISPRPLVFRFGNELNLSISVQQTAAELLKKAAVNGLAKMGKDPKGLAAAALYICAKKSREKRTQTEIANVSRITEVTLRTRAKQIKSCLHDRAD
ncbi:MAG: transcription initiation factor IIB [Candidatus Sigynarchaeota archaeon]